MDAWALTVLPDLESIALCYFSIAASEMFADV